MNYLFKSNGSIVDIYSNQIISSNLRMNNVTDNNIENLKKLNTEFLDNCEPSLWKHVHLGVGLVHQHQDFLDIMVQVGGIKVAFVDQLQHLLWWHILMIMLDMM